jgi:hypothetical protein
MVRSYWERLGNVAAKEVAPSMLARGLLLFIGATAGTKAGPESMALGPGEILCSAHVCQS